MTNAIVKVDPRNLNFHLTPLNPRFGASYGVLVTGVPADVTGVYLRIFTQGDGYFDCPANQDDNGDWTVKVIGTCFPAAGRFRYEVRAQDEDGALTALGEGPCIVAPFSAGNTPTTPGTVISVATLPDATGALHQVVAVNLGTAEEPDWTWQVKTVNGAV